MPLIRLKRWRTSAIAHLDTGAAESDIMALRADLGPGGICQMADYDNRLARSSGVVVGEIDAGLRAHMLRVYNYMFVGLVLTGLTAWAAADTPLRDVFFQVNEATGRMGLTGLGWIAMFAPLGIVFFLSFGIQRMSVAT